MRVGKVNRNEANAPTLRQLQFGKRQSCPPFIAGDIEYDGCGIHEDGGRDLTLLDSQSLFRIGGVEALWYYVVALSQPAYLPFAVPLPIAVS